MRVLLFRDQVIQWSLVNNSNFSILLFLLLGLNRFSRFALACLFIFRLNSIFEPLFLLQLFPTLISQSLLFSSGFLSLELLFDYLVMFVFGVQALSDWVNKNYLVQLTLDFSECVNCNDIHDVHTIRNKGIYLLPIIR